MEAATHLRYEGVPFRSIVLMSKQHEWISGPVGDGYIAFKRPLGFSQALIEEKWIRAISASTEVGLHGLGHSGNIVGIVALSTDASISSGGAVLPTELQPIASLVRAGTMAFVCAPNGDLYVVLPSGAVFVKSQGSWHYQNFSSFQSLLSKYVPQPIAQPLLRLLLDLSYKRKGALFCVPADLSTVEQLVPDHTNVSARVILTPCAEVRVTHLGEYGGFLEAADVDPGASSGDTSHGPTGRRDQGDREASGMLT
jgi:hypothetical protein